jgi:pimeloyl-ACP methyl ester carboxylesterase
MTALALTAFSEGHGPPLIMLGGGTMGAAQFAEHARALASDFRVIRLQTLNVERAQRNASLPTGYSIKMESDAMRCALDHMDLLQPVHIVGHSLGALVALDFALDQPERVRSLVLSEPPAFWVVSPQEIRASSEMQIITGLVRQFRPEREPSDEQVAQFDQLLGGGRAHSRSSADDREANWASRRMALRGLSAVPEHRDKVSRLQNFRRPVLLIGGSDSALFHRRINELLESHLPTSEHVELYGGHQAISESRDAFLAGLRSFLSRLDS